MVPKDLKPELPKCFGLLVGMLAVFSSLSFADDHKCRFDVDSYCRDVFNSTGGKLSFVDHYHKQKMFLMATRCSYLSCCTGNHSHVNSTWYKCKKGSWCLQEKWAVDCVDWNYRFTRDEGQTLIIYGGNNGSDSGQYLCVATDGHATINRTFDVQFVDCIEHTTVVHFSTPANAEASLGSRYSQRCLGDFGCKGGLADDNLAWWSYFDLRGRLQNLTLGKHGRYTVQEERSEDETSKGAILTIEGVAQEDFGRVFVCQLKMRDLSTVGFNFSLSETGSKTTWKKYIPVIITLSVTFGIVVMTALLIYLCCLPMVMFCYKSTANTLPKRESRHSFDVMLISREEPERDDEDARVLETMRERLESEGFSVYSLHSGAAMKQYDDVARCVSVIFVISTSLLQREENYLTGFDRYFAIAAEEKTNILLVSTQGLSSAEWERLSGYRIFVHAPKLWQALTWYGEPGCLGFKGKKFWCQVRCFLPKPRPPNARQDETTDAVAAEQSPLTGDAASPVEV